MIHSIYHNKCACENSDGREDPKTSSVFGTMLMLPDEMFWGVLRRACFDNDNLPELAGQIIEYAFWPHWDHTDTTNSNFVEPDIFIRFHAFDLIIEAKRNDWSGQYSQQWKKEITAYHNEYGHNKPVHFIALGGNADKWTEQVKVDKQHTTVNKCTWLSLLIQINKLRQEYEAISMALNSQSALRRLFSYIELAFNIHNVYCINWFDDMRTSKPFIDSDSISTLKDFFSE